MDTARDNVELMKNAAEEGYKTTLQLGELNLRTWQKMAEAQMDAFGLWVDASVKQMELASNSKDYKDYVTSQAKLVREFGEDLMAKNREALDLAAEAREDYRSWYEKTVSTTTETLKNAAPKAE